MFTRGQKKIKLESLNLGHLEKLIKENEYAYTVLTPMDYLRDRDRVATKHS